jgi:predicted ATPase/DNA-binding winged helix-turn-helix (wHTH) protein
LDGDEPVTLGARALNLLIALTSQAGEILTKEQLISSVWPGIFVDDNNLRVHVSAIRRALRDGQDGNRYIVNIPGRGYSFVAPIQVIGARNGEPTAATDHDWTARLPIATSRIFGRAAVVDTLCAQLAQRRFITLVGPGGIGKTTVAVAVARSMAVSYRDGVCFVDLTSIRDPALVPGTILSALGQSISSADAIVTLVAYVARLGMLLVLDNCEHVIEIAATTAEKVSDGAPDVHVLCTSREPLRAAGERLYRLRPLEAPPSNAGLTAEEALTFPCIQLFVERAAAAQDSFSLSDADVPVVAELCQRLDGIALAIELAAGRVAAFGLRELAARLDDRFRLLTSGRRTALPRHQTLTATLDWSYELLPASEQALLRHLSVFAGEFSLNAAVAMVAHFEATAVMEDIAGLVSKSLVVAELRSGSMRYRLLETTRIYCGEKLRLAGDLASARRVHAAYMLDIFATAETDAARLPTEEWMENYASQLDNVRTALDWAASNEGQDGTRRPRRRPRRQYGAPPDATLRCSGLVHDVRVRAR